LVNNAKICIISTFPPEGGGVSTYTKNLIEAIDLTKFKIIILSKKNREVSVLKKEKSFANEVDVIPCWNAGIRYPFQIFKALCRYKPKIVHIQHEYFIFGGAFSAALFPFFILLTKSLDLKVIVTFHGIVNPAEIRDPELGSIGNENLKGMPRLLSQMALLLITRLITDNSDRIIVMNNTHKNVLIQEYHCSPQKITLIPHGVPQCKQIDQDTAKKKLGLEGLKVALYFGYITKYKGIDILVKAFKNIESSNSLLVIGGAPHPRLKSDPDYKKFWDSINREISEDKRIKFVGFIPEGLLSDYISASDIVVFPYLASFSTGGPMNITLGHHKPIIASRVSSFSDVLPKSAIFKTGSVSDLSMILKKALNDDCFNLELSKLTGNIADDRSWKQVARSTADLYSSINQKS
jgi:glycosyltransferase involved in cell wall biosynthesis